MSVKKQRRFTIAIVGIFAMLGGLAFSGPANAADLSTEIPSTVVEGIGTLEMVAFSDEGVEVPVTGEIVSVDTVKRGGQQSQAVTIDVSAGSSPSANLKVGNSEGRCGNDGSSSVNACITIYFDIKSSPSYYYANVTGYTAKWTRMDTAATITNGKVVGMKGGTLCTGGLAQTESKTWNKASPVSGTNYSYTPPWAGAYVMLYDNAPGQQVHTELTWKRGTATYTLLTRYVLAQDGGWPKYGGCI